MAKRHVLYLIQMPKNAKRNKMDLLLHLYDASQYRIFFLLNYISESHSCLSITHLHFFTLLCANM